MIFVYGGLFIAARYISTLLIPWESIYDDELLIGKSQENRGKLVAQSHELV